MVTPVITQPPDGSEVGRVVTVEGTMGMVGATLQLRDKRFGRPLGEPKVLSQDGDWSIDNISFTPVGIGPLTITSQPQSITNTPGTAASFTVGVSGLSPY